MTHFPNIANGATPPKEPTHPVLPLPAALNAHTWMHARHIVKPQDVNFADGFDFVGLMGAVNEHLTNLLGTESRKKAARMLWMQGKPGFGKTTTAKRACLKAGYHVAVISAGTFAGEVEGAPVKVLNDLMAELERWSAVHRAPVVLLLDDFDNSTANVGKDAGHTINSQLLTNEMMALCDKRGLYVNHTGAPIPILVSCNDATGMRESLHRTGRAAWFTHDPSAEDRANFAWFVLQPQTTAERELVTKLVAKNIRQSIAFWEALPLKMRAIQNAKHLAKGVPDQRTIDAHFNAPLPLLPEIAWEASRQLRISRINFLNSKRWGRR